MLFPKGVRKVIELYRDRIEAKVGADVDWNTVYGCGSFGCVFSIRGTRSVLKISTDPTEGPVTQAIIDTGLDKRLDGLARFDRVWKIPGEIQPGPRGTAWVIVREDVKPFSFNELGWGRIPKWLGALTEYNRFSQMEIRFMRGSKAERAEEDARSAIGDLYNYEETYFVAEAIEELRRNEIVLADVHAGNLGSRFHDWGGEGDGQGPSSVVRWFDGKDRPALLIFDPGHSSSPPGIRIEDLWAEGVRANPWMEGVAEGVEEI